MASDLERPPAQFPASLHPNMADDDGRLQLHLLHFTGQKAGMNHIDTQHVHQIIYDASKDSAYYRNQQRQAERVSKKLDEIKSKIGIILPQDKQKAALDAERQAQRLREQIRLDRMWICVDLDMFFAAVAIRDQPDLRDKPVVVGDMQMISTASYKARRYGVRSAMPGFIAVRLCPELVFVKSDFPAYQAAAAKFRAIFADYDPLFTSWSLDEAALDVTDYIRSRSGLITSEDVAREIRQRIFDTTRLTASCGIACNQMLAKICSDLNKPNGQYCLPSDRQSIETFMKDLPPRKIPGIGRVTERILKEIAIEKCGDFIKEIAIAKRLFTPSMIEWLMRVMIGSGRSQRSESDLEFQPRKSYSVSRTFSNLHRCEDLEQKLKEIAEKLIRDTHGHPGKTLTLTVKSVNFQITSKAVTLPTYIMTLDDIVHHGTTLLRSLYPLQLRLIGLRLSSLAPEGYRDSGSRQQSMDHFVRRESNCVTNTEPRDPSEDFGDLIDCADQLESDGNAEFDVEISEDENFSVPDVLLADPPYQTQPANKIESGSSLPAIRPIIKPFTYAAALWQRNQIPVLNRSRLLNKFCD